jgi:hypothetical protein
MEIVFVPFRPALKIILQIISTLVNAGQIFAMEVLALLAPTMIRAQEVAMCVEVILLATWTVLQPVKIDNPVLQRAATQNAVFQLTIVKETMVLVATQFVKEVHAELALNLIVRLLILLGNVILTQENVYIGNARIILIARPNFAQATCAQLAPQLQIARMVMVALLRQAYAMQLIVQKMQTVE